MRSVGRLGWGRIAGEDIHTSKIISPGDLTLESPPGYTTVIEPPVWDDMRTPSNQSKKIPGLEAKDQAYKGGIVIKFEDHIDQGVAFNVQMSHKYKLNTDIEFHIHIALPVAGSGGGAENAKFDFTHSWAAIGGTFPAATTVNATRDVQADPADKHILMEIAASIDGSSIGSVSSMLICSLTRDVSVANNYANDVYFIEADFHYQIDTMGSREEAAK